MSTRGPSHYKTRSREVVHTMTRSEARELVATKEREIVLDRGDLAQMTEILRDIGDAADGDRLRALVAEMSGYFDYMRMQLPA